MVLVPRKGEAEEIEDFTPVSLVSSLYILLTKVLANKLKEVVGRFLILGIPFWAKQIMILYPLKWVMIRARDRSLEIFHLTCPGDSSLFL